MKIMNKPAVSVVLPVYNAGKHLVSAIGSIVDQSFQDWELICVNDGSTDQSPLILDWFANRDPRIHVIHQENAGVVSAANRCHQIARADLICRMDADDIAMPDRLSHQVDFMDNHSEHVAISGSILEIDVDSEPLGLQTLASNHETIVQRLLNRETGLFQPASIMRADAFRKVGGYRRKYQWIEDHDLWLRLSQVGRLGNTKELVLFYRQHTSSGTWQKSNRQRDLMTELLREAYAQRNLPDMKRTISTPPSRSGAGPGKWARKAIRGGYPRTAWKHLRKLWKEDGLTWYTLRMFAEVGLRLPAAASSNLRIPTNILVPSLNKWKSIAPAISCDTQDWFVTRGDSTMTTAH